MSEPYQSPDRDSEQESENTDTTSEGQIDDADVAAFYEQADDLAPQGDDRDVPATHLEIVRLNEELANAKDQIVRALAEAENTRKRAAREREDANRYAISAFAKDLLSVSDNLRRALESMPNTEETQYGEQLKALIEGVEATERELLRVFESKGIKAVEALHTPFDPNFHEVMFEASDPTKPAGTIIQVVQTGYTLHDRLLRPARVGIVRDDGQGSGGNSPSPEAGSTIDTEA